MTREVDYFSIEGAYGGSQEWFTNVVMNIGGCAAATACDSSIYFAKEFGLTHLYPYDINNLNKEDYKKFSQIMKPYISPRVMGVKKAKWYIDGFKKYIDDVDKREGTNTDISMRELPGSESYDSAKTAVINQIDDGYPIPYLMLKHRQGKFADFAWHWFLITGYDILDNKMYIKVATYAHEHKLPFEELWNTGYSEKGGIVLYKSSHTF
ncbi:MAG: hypothetical protein ACK5LL_07080 [Suipraeoptans sp.]